MITQLPGFQTPIPAAQATFRALLNAVAHPGAVQDITAISQPPESLNPACAAVCLTLLDLETRLWLSPGVRGTARNWLSFHTNCQFVRALERAEFALIAHPDDLPPLSQFHQGQVEHPEHSTTLFYQIPALVGGSATTISGPGIRDRREITPQVPQAFWSHWRKNRQAYPQGVDVYLLAGTQVMGLPRTVVIESSL